MAKMGKIEYSCCLYLKHGACVLCLLSVLTDDNMLSSVNHLVAQSKASHRRRRLVTSASIRIYFETFFERSTSRSPAALNIYFMISLIRSR